MEDMPRKKIGVKIIGDINSDGRESYLRAIVTEENGILSARLTGNQGSGNLLSLVQANSLLIIPPGVRFVPSGSEVDAWWLDSG